MSVRQNAARKIACDRRKPTCDFCIKNHFDCEYAAARRPGLRAGYIAKLDRRLIELEQRVWMLEGHSKESAGNDQEVSTPGVSHPDASINAVYSGEKDLPMPNAPSQTALTTPNASSDDNTLARHSFQFDPFSYPVLSELCSIWFKRYHPWFPILHQPSLMDSLQHLKGSETLSQRLAVKAICAVTLTHYESPLVSADEREHWSDRLRESVYFQALQQACLQSVQALLIISNIEYGSGRFEKFWNVIALCKRMSSQLGYGTLVKKHADHINSSASVPPRLHPLSTTIIDREERIRAYWMSEMLDSMSTVGVDWDTGASLPMSNGILPCSDSLWAFPEHIINIWSFGQFRYSSAFSWQTEAQKIDERLTAWREEFVAAVYRLINAEYAEEERAEMDPNIVLTNCVLDIAVVLLFQRMSTIPREIDPSTEPWQYATNRCIYACDNMVFKVGQMTDEELSVSNPHLVFCFFTVARFYIVYAKTVNADVPAGLELVCGEPIPDNLGIYTKPGEVMYDMASAISAEDFICPRWAASPTREPKTFLDFLQLKITHLFCTMLDGYGLEVVLTAANSAAQAWYGYDQGVVSGILISSDFINVFPETKVSSIQGITASCFSFSAYSFPQLIVGRVINGVGNGMTSSTCGIFQAESCPSDRRGKLSVIVVLHNVVFYCAATWLTLACSFLPGGYQWRLPLALQLIPAMFLIGLLSFVPDSPRWLLMRGKTEAGLEAIRRYSGKGLLTDDPRVQSEYHSIIGALRIERESKISFIHILARRDRSSHLKRLLLGCGGQFMQQFGGINALNYYFTIILMNNLGMNELMARILTGCNATSYMISSALCFGLIERCGRRVLMLSGLSFQCFAYVMVAISIALLDKAPYEWGIVAVSFLFFYYAAFGCTWGMVPWVYQAEINSLAMRTVGAAAATATNWLAGFICTQFTPTGIEEIGYKFYIIFAVFNLTFILVVYFLYPETAYRTLEDVDVYFDRDSNHRTIIPIHDKTAKQTMRPLEAIEAEAARVAITEAADAKGSSFQQIDDIDRVV
ncbi:uncharacterized protein N7482_004006 [Penicillium canariense]|uniref:Major facilitator superfamily (MFS) profile domain-containing protein n=1 Tax=Penicillium canariense TaxID=189055 RepID=A0A9W9I9M9_9EURO|nr:uncharacterized protein N7482_004006 [Penicillium canariense]KAJ5168412.1 hypothetical protein N7482_004006 [Penicillium canariense]